MINRRAHVDALLISFMTIEKWSKTWVRSKYFSVESKYVMPQSFSSRKWKQSSKAYVMIMSLAYALKTVCRYRILSFSELASLHRESIFFKRFLIIGSTLRMLTLKKNSLMLFRRIRCTSWSIVTMIEFETDESRSLALNKIFDTFDAYFLISVRWTRACLSFFLQSNTAYWWSLSRWSELHLNWCARSNLEMSMSATSNFGNQWQLHMPYSLCISFIRRKYLSSRKIS